MGTDQTPSPTRPPTLEDLKQVGAALNAAPTKESIAALLNDLFERFERLSVNPEMCSDISFFLG